MERSLPVHPNRYPNNLFQQESSTTLDESIIYVAQPDWTHEWREDALPKKRASYCCGCFSSRRGCLAVCIPVWLFVILALAISGYFLFPRFPTIQIGTPYVLDSKQAFQYNATDSGQLNAISYDLMLNFTVTSNNYWDYYASSILATVRTPIIF